MLKPLKPFGLAIEIKDQRDLETLTGETLLYLAKEHSLLILRGLRNFTPLELRNFALSFPNSSLLEWETGAIMEMKPKRDPSNYLFSREKVPFHWDGAFFNVPDFLIFQCIKAPGQEAGGETLFTNTVNLHRTLSQKDREFLGNISLTYKTEKLAHYGGEFTTPVLTKHPLTGKGIVRFAEEVTTELNPVSLKVEGTNDSRSLIEGLTSKIYSDEFCYAHEWKQGDVLIADNHALLHGRRPFKIETERHLRRVQVRVSHEVAS